MQKKGPPPKKQRPISSFFGLTPAARDLSAQADPAADSQQRAERQHDSHHEPLTVQVPIKTRPSLAALASLDSRAAHARWQAKLVGDEPGGIQPSRVRTQEGVEQQQAGVKGKLTPLEQQVERLQARHPDCLLAIECGYKYRFFGRDAEVASRVLGIFAYPDRNYLSAGVPVGRVEHHLRRLVAAGLKVGLVRQTETAAIKKASDNRSKPFERELTAVYTRATLEAGDLAALAGGGAAARVAADPGGGDDDAEDAGEAPPAQDRAWSSQARVSYLVCVVEEPGELRGGGAAGASTLGVVAVEVSTGDVLHSQFVDGSMRPGLESRLMYAAPSELLVVEPVSGPTRRLLASYGAGSGSAGVRTERVAGGAYRDGGALAAVTAFYGSAPAGGAAPLGGQGGAAVDAALALPPLVLRALAHALDYLQPFGLAAVLRLGPSFREFSAAMELALTPNALQQLEILRSSEGGERGSLLWLMDRTATAPGARLMRHWVSRPLREVAAIEERLDAVEELLRHGDEHFCLSRLPGVLRALPDTERSLTRALHRTSSPPEFLVLLRTFDTLHVQLGLQADLGEESAAGSAAAPRLAVPGVSSPLLLRLLRSAADLRCAAVARDTLASLDAEAAAAGDKQRLFADDERFPDVAARRGAVAAAERALQGLRPVLAAALNVRSVEYVSLQNQGDYLVEVAVELERRAPKDWERVSTTKKMARFRPPAVKRALAELEVAREHLAATAASAWVRLLGEFSEHCAAFRAAVHALAALDCLCGLASLATSAGYVRPRFVPDDAPPQLHIEGGRHPVLDVLLEGGFVPNDTLLGGGPGAELCAVITGPNMGGKSCLIRQAALIVCMAQAGSFVPARAARLHAFDAVFTRMGAADSIALGRSTFLEELGETSAILSSATPRSLVIIDELGRGTSTRDGVAIAQATLEHVVRSVRCLTMFVTHYPEVTTLQAGLGGALGCYYMAYVAETEDDGAAAERTGIPKVTFLYRLVRGVAQASFGLNVARMAGLPESVVERAAQKAAEAAEAARLRGEAAIEGLARRVMAKLEAAARGEGDPPALRGLQVEVGAALNASGLLDTSM